MIALCNAIRQLGKEPLYIQQSSAGYAWVRTMLFRQAREILKTDTAHGLMIDDDILLTSGSAFAEAVKIADAQGYNFAAPYLARDWSERTPEDIFGNNRHDPWIVERPTTARRSSIASANGHSLPVSEVEKIPAWSKIPLAGLGFFYGELPLTYEFRDSSRDLIGEDYCFFHDNKIALRLAPFWVRHIKTMIL